MSDLVPVAASAELVTGQPVAQKRASSGCRTPVSQSSRGAAGIRSGRFFGAALGLVADRLLGEPPVPGRLHPVAAFGSVTVALERRLYRDARLPGALYACLGSGLAWAAGRLARSPALGCYLTTSGRALHTAATDVGDALERGDLDTARGLLPTLVGRDPAGLDEMGIARAVVESVAENTTDAIVAPAFWTAAGGAPAAFVHRAADTMDSMVGYRNGRYGRFGAASAQLDDTMAWPAARLTGALVALVRPRRAGDILRAVREDAPTHPSPNAGVAEAAFAAALDLQLGGPTRYGPDLERRPLLGRGHPPTAKDIPAAVALSRDVSWALAGLLALLGTVTHQWGRHRRNGASGPPRGR